MWALLASAPRDGTVLDLWQFKHSIPGRLFPRVRWGASADRDPIRFGPGGQYPHLGQTGWYHVNEPIDRAGSILVEEQFSHWRLASFDFGDSFLEGPTEEQMAQYLMLLKLKGKIR